MTTLRTLAVLALATVTLAGCAAQLRTASAPVDAGDDALTSGRLVADARTGLALSDATGKVTPVLWPFGFSARSGLSGLELVDERGKVVAREGDFVEITGGFGADETWRACPGSVTVVPAQG